MVVWDIASLVAGLLMLVWSADQFVLGSSRLAALFALPPVVIGAVVMGFGTSAPELLVSSLAAAGGDLDLGVGNIVGSNVANLSLVLGAAALFSRMVLPDGVFRREAPMSIAAAVLFAVFVVDGRLERWEGAVLAVSLVVAIVTLIRSGRSQADLEELIDPGDSRMSRGRESGRTFIGLAGTVLGAQLVVWGATDIAEEVGVTGGFIGFSLVALGTSLPELVTTIACARRRETDLIVGNLFGSNIFNALAVGGGMALIGPGPIGDESLTTYGIAAMLTIAVVSFVLAAIGRSVGRVDAIILLSLYVGAMVLLAVQEQERLDDEEAFVVEPSVSVVVDA